MIPVPLESQQNEQDNVLNPTLTGHAFENEIELLCDKFANMLFDQWMEDKK